MEAESRKSRKEQLTELFSDPQKAICGPLIEEMLYLEAKLTELKALPWILVKPKNKAVQQQTDAAKLYAALLSRYTDIVSKLATLEKKNDVQEDSPLREFLKNLN